MASSHTGKLTGADDVMSAALRQFGVTRVDGLDELPDTAQFVRPQPRPADRQGRGASTRSPAAPAPTWPTCSASPGVPLPDAVGGDTAARCTSGSRPYLRVSNPVDNGGHPVGDERGRKILDALVADPDVGLLICPITGAFPPMSDSLAQDLVDVAETTDKPICVIWGSPVGTEHAYRDILLGSSRVTVFRTFGNCVTADAGLDGVARLPLQAAPAAGPDAAEPRPPPPRPRAPASDDDGVRGQGAAARVRDPDTGRDRRRLGGGGGPGGAAPRLAGRDEGVGGRHRPQVRARSRAPRRHVRSGGEGDLPRARRGHGRR